eukprot:TCALIF_03377-PA protein Name:"Protein of unknown function" AED:0.53 eAED:0.53 QI:0/0/0/0.33/1/1/3/0/269
MSWTLIILTTLVVVSISNAHLLPQPSHQSFILKRQDLFSVSVKSKRSLEDEVQLSDSLLLARSHIGFKQSVSLPNLKASTNHHSVPKRSLSKRSALPVAPYRGHNFQRNVQLRQRPIKNRSRYYSTQAHLIRPRTSPEQETGLVLTTTLAIVCASNVQLTVGGAHRLLKDRAQISSNERLIVAHHSLSGVHAPIVLGSWNPQITVSEILSESGSKRTLTKRSAHPAAPYRGYNFRRNAALRRRPIQTRSRYYRNQRYRNRNRNRGTSSG